MERKDTCNSCKHCEWPDRSEMTLEQRTKAPDLGECRKEVRKTFMAILPGPDGRPMPQLFHVWPNVQRHHWCSQFEPRVKH